MRHLLVVIAALGLCAGSGYAEEPDEIVAEGLGEGVNRQEALTAAKRSAVEKGIGMILLSQTEVENFQLKRDQIITKTIGAVKSYEVLSETTSPEGLHRLKIRAVLSRVAMHEDLAAFHILIESMNKPRVMIIVNENNVGNEEPANNAAETALIAFLKDPYDFEVVDPRVVASIRASEQKMAEVRGDAAAAAALGSRHGAEVVITGQAVGRVAEGISKSLGGMSSVQADITLRAINCTSGRIIGSADAHAAKVHVSPNTAGTQAIAKASVEAGKELLDAVMQDWQDQLNNGIPLVVSVEKVSTFRVRKNVLATLEAVAGVDAVRERNWDSHSKVLKVDIQYKGNAAGFCDKVDALKMHSGGGSLGVSGLDGLNVTLVARVM